MNAMAGFFIMLGLFFLGSDIVTAAKVLANAIKERA